MLTVKVLEATNTKGTRVKVQGQADAVTVAWDHALSAEDNACHAVRAYFVDPSKGGTWVVAFTPDHVTTHGWVALRVAHAGPLRVLPLAAFQAELGEMRSTSQAVVDAGLCF